MPSLHHLVAEAARLGYTVHTRPMVHRLGVCDPQRRVILLDKRLTTERAAFVLAHELEHARRGHDCRREGTTEEHLDEIAARRIIDHDAYVRAERRWGSDAQCIADDLGTCPEAVGAYRRWLHRAGAVPAEA